jgi:hypothetical protein
MLLMGRYPDAPIHRAGPHPLCRVQRGRILDSEQTFIKFCVEMSAFENSYQFEGKPSTNSLQNSESLDMFRTVQHFPSKPAARRPESGPFETTPPMPHPK